MPNVSPSRRALAPVAILAVVLAAAPAQAQTAAERPLLPSCAADPGVRVDGDGLLRFTADTSPDSTHSCVVSQSRTPGGVLEARIRVFPTPALARQFVTGVLNDLAEIVGDPENAADLQTAGAVLGGLMTHAVVVEADAAVRCETGEALRESAGFYDLTGLRLFGISSQFVNADGVAPLVRALCAE